MISGSTALQYHMELGVEGYVDGGPGGLCTSDRLRLLRERRVRWMRLGWQHMGIMDANNIIPVTPLPYELQGGAFFNVTTRNGAFVINQTRLPSSVQPEPLYLSHTRDRQFVDITTDPSQDLMVLLDVQGQ